MGGQCQAPKREVHVPNPDAALSSHQKRSWRAPCTPAAHVPGMLLFVQKRLCWPGGKTVLACKNPFLPLTLQVKINKSKKISVEVLLSQNGRGCALCTERHSWRCSLLAQDEEAACSAPLTLSRKPVSCCLSCPLAVLASFLFWPCQFLDLGPSPCFI